jgi:hypothetical protein
VGAIITATPNQSAAQVPYSPACIKPLAARKWLEKALLIRCEIKPGARGIELNEKLAKEASMAGKARKLEVREIGEGGGCLIGYIAKREHDGMNVKRLRLTGGPTDREWLAALQVDAERRCKIGTEDIDVGA